MRLTIQRKLTYFTGERGTIGSAVVLQCDRLEWSSCTEYAFSTMFMSRTEDQP